MKNVLMGIDGLRFLREDGFINFMKAIYDGHTMRHEFDGFIWSGFGFGEGESNFVITEYNPLTGEHFSRGKETAIVHKGFAGRVSISGGYGFVSFCGMYLENTTGALFKEMVIGRSPFIGVLS